MVEIEDLEVGMKVKIVDQWNAHTCQNPDGRMDRWLGQIVTVAEVQLGSNGDGYIFIEEDKLEDYGHWYWNKHCIDYIVQCEDLTDNDPSSKADIASFLFESVR